MIYLGADHRGFKLKEQIKTWLIAQKYSVNDCGNLIFDPHDDFPDFTFAVADKVAVDPQARGIVICGSAGGVTIAANKVIGIRCVTAVNINDVIHNRQHDNVNILALSSDFTSLDEAKKMITVFLNTKYLAEERHVRRLKKIAERES